MPRPFPFHNNTNNTTELPPTSFNLPGSASARLTSQPFMSAHFFTNTDTDADPLLSPVHSARTMNDPYYQQQQQQPLPYPPSYSTAFSTVSPPTSPRFDESLFAESFMDSALFLPPPCSAASPTLSTSDDDSSSSSGASLSSSSFSYPDWPTLPPSAAAHTSPTGSPVPQSSSSATAHTGSSTAVVASKKRKLTKLSEAERLMRRRAQHRAVDASRRQRETEAIERLRSLTQQLKLGEREQDNEADDDGEEDEDGATGEGKRAGRLTVLESSIALIEQLTTACKRIEASSNAKGAQLSRVSNHLHTVAATIAQVAASSMEDGAASPGSSAPIVSRLPAQSSSYHSALVKRPQLVTSGPSPLQSMIPGAFLSYLDQADRSHTLCQTSLSMLSAMCVFVMSVSSHVLVDMNSAFLQVVRARRSDLLYQSVDLVSLDKKGSQYPASINEADAIIGGRKRRGHILWRCRTFDGLKYETRALFFADYDVPPTHDPSDSEPRIPDRVLVMFAPEDVIMLDDARITNSLLY